jgi:archaellum component FlaF (FlaF/FlaG flagellin family)
LEINQLENDQNPVRKIDTQRLILIGGCIIAFLMLLTLSYIIMAFTNPKIYDEVKAENIDISNLTKDEAKAKLNEYYSKAKEAKVTIKTDNYSESINLSDLNVQYDLESAVNSAYRLGREGSFPKRLAKITRLDIKGETISVPVKYDTQKIDSIIDDLEKNVASNIKEHTYEITDSRLFFTYGHSGMGIDKNEVKKGLEGVIKKGTGQELYFSVKNIEPQPFDVNSISAEPIDAKVIVENYSNLYKRTIWSYCRQRRITKII